jgi:phosphatidylethanolamine-binding protein (PEBP) family uncharacterized protein
MAEWRLPDHPPLDDVRLQSEMGGPRAALFSFTLDLFTAPGQSPPHEDQVHHYCLHYYLLTQALAERSSSAKIL